MHPLTIRRRDIIAPMSEGLALAGARNYFGQSVFALACGTGSLKERIKRAHEYALTYVKTADFNNFDLKKRIETVIDEARNTESLDDNGAIAVANEIVEIAFLLRGP
jgi:hypothetical protein